MRPIRFEVPGDPRGKGSVRATIIGKKTTNPMARTFTDPETRSYMATIQQHAQAAMDDRGLAPLKGPVVLGIRAYRRKGRPGTGVGDQAAEMDALRPTSVADADNYAKAVGDGLNGVCFLDDAQVVRLVVEKRFSERPRMEVAVMPWRPAESILVRLRGMGGRFVKWVDRNWGSG